MISNSRMNGTIGINPFVLFSAFMIIAALAYFTQSNRVIFKPEDKRFEAIGQARVLSGKRIELHGDTFILATIDVCTPVESKCGTATKSALYRAVYGKDVHCIWRDVTPQKARLARCKIVGDEEALDALMVGNGFATAKKKNGKPVDPKLANIEAHAAAEKRGFWSSDYKF